MASKLYVLLNNYLRFLVWNNMIIKKNHIYSNQKTFLLIINVEKTSGFEVDPTGHTIAYKNIDNLFNNELHIIYIVLESKNIC